MKFIPFLLAILFISCSPSQFTLYKPVESEPAWRVTVEKKIITNNFACVINDSVVVEESFGFFKNNFEKDGEYKGKKVKMSGYQTQHTITDSNGKSNTSTTYQIRVFIDEHEVGKFDF